MKKKLLSLVLGAAMVLGLVGNFGMTAKAVPITPKIIAPETVEGDDFNIGLISSGDVIVAGMTIFSTSESWDVYIDDTKVGNIVNGGTSYTFTQDVYVYELNGSDEFVCYSRVPQPNLIGIKWTLEDMLDDWYLIFDEDGMYREYLNGDIEYEFRYVASDFLLYIPKYPVIDCAEYQECEYSVTSTTLEIDWGEYSGSYILYDAEEPDPEDPEEPKELYYTPLEDDIVAEAKASKGAAKTVEWDEGTALPISVMEELKANPNLSLLFTFEYEGKEHTVLIPAGGAFVDEDIPWYGPAWLLNKYGEYNPATAGKYTVASGDTLGALAAKFNTTVDELKKKNPDIKDANLIYPGQTINY